MTSTDWHSEYLTIPEAARLLRCGPRILRAARDRGELPVYRLSDRWERVRRPELLAWVRSQQVRPTGHAEARVREVLDRERADQ